MGRSLLGRCSCTCAERVQQVLRRTTADYRTDRSGNSGFRPRGSDMGTNWEVSMPTKMDSA